MQYINGIDVDGDLMARDADAALAPPFGSGLGEWIRKSPVFNVERTNAAVQIVALGKNSLISMWEPYARLRYLNKPVDAVMLNDDEHRLTNPRARLASQGGTVDWFRFWLKDEEDSGSEKGSQYRRWRKLRDLHQQDLERTQKLQ
jgi:hypothetical protein